ncbi:hypothetical protein Holit_00182 [Hollandina sp. SP2]
MVFTRVYRYETVCVVLFYSLVSTVSIKEYRITDAFSYGVFIYLEIMLAALGFLYINDFLAVPLNDDLRFQRMALSFPNSTLFDPF